MRRGLPIANPLFRRLAAEEGAMKILIGVDDSPHSRAAVEFVKKMTWPKDTKVVVLSVVRPVVGIYAEAYVPVQSDFERVTEEMVRFHQETASGAERELRAAGFQTDAKVLTGDPRATLIELAETERADLIILGSHGRTGMAKLMMGSVASHVATHAPCSVMVVKLPSRA
jgi:nucleotide-binding universal stress UspA family protein